MQIPSKDNCYENGFDYYGSDVGNVANVPTATKCQGECQKRSDCLTFTYIKPTKTCLLKNGYPSKAVNPDYISGPKQCFPKGNI